MRVGNVNTFPELMRTPGYPIFLSLMPNLWTALVVQAVLSGVVVFAICTFVSYRWGVVAGIISSAMLITDVPSIVYSNQLMTESLFTSLFIGAFLCLLSAARPGYGDSRRVRVVTVSSVLLGGATAIRPIGELALAVPALVLLAFDTSRRRRAGFVALLVATSMMLIVGWSARNYRLTGEFVYSPIGAINFFYYRAIPTVGAPVKAGQGSLTGQSLRIIVHHPWSFARLTAWSFLYLCLVPDRHAVMNLLDIQRSFRLQNAGPSRARTALSAIYTSPRETLRAVYREEFGSSFTMLTLASIQIVLLTIMWTGAVVGLRLLGLRSYEARCITLCAAAAFSLLLLAAGAEALDRLRIPAVPLLAVLSGVGWSSLIPRQTQACTE
jgi:4-amino-4-deoxy-L-arabinose transferase-like glycosyltransferase